MASVLTTRAANRALGLAAVVCLALAGCTSTPDNRLVSLPVPQTPAQSEQQPAVQREHARILASYGGVYENAKLQSMVEKTVDRLVAASERPDLKYQVTILNSQAINAFALPNGRLYVTRGKFKEAEPLLAKTVMLSKREMPPGFMGTGITLMAHGEALTQLLTALGAAG
jgi:predicted Zn-dependent protease